MRSLAEPDESNPDPAPYAAALLRAAEFLSAPPPSSTTAAAFPVPRTASPAGPRDLHRRFQMLLTAPPPRRPGRAVRFALFAATAAVLLAGVTVGQENPPDAADPVAPVPEISEDPLDRPADDGTAPPADDGEPEAVPADSDPAGDDPADDGAGRRCDRRQADQAASRGGTR